MRTLQSVLAGLVLSLCGVLSAQPTTLTQSSSPAVLTNGSVACGNVFGQGDNSYYRIYNAASIFTVTAIRFGVEVDYDAPSNISLRLWNVAATTATTFTLGTQIGGTTTFATPGNGSWSGTFRTISLNAPIQLPPGQFAVEVFQATNQAVQGNFFLGSNGLGETGPTYLRAPLCGINTPTTVGSIVAGQIHYIIDVIGYLAPALAPDPEIDVRFPAGAQNSVASAGTINVGPRPAGVASSVQVEVANQGTTVNLTVSTPVASAPVNCTVAAIAAPGPIAPGAQTLINISVTPSAGLGTWSFTLTIPNTDINEGSYVLTVQGTRGMSGTYTVGAAQTYADLGLAFNDLEQFGVAGAVTLSVSAGTYTPNVNYGLGSTGGVAAPVRGLSATNTLTIARASASAQVILSGAAAVDPNAAITGCMSVFACGFVTIDGITFTSGVGFGLWVGHDSFRTNRVSNVTIRNCKAHSIASGPGIAVYNDSRPMDNVLIQNCMVWDCAAGNTFYAMELPGSIALFQPGANTVVEHCTVVNNIGATAAANIGQPGAIGYWGPNFFNFEAVRTSPIIRNNVLVASGANRPCIWFPNDDPLQVAAAGPYPPTAANRNVLFAQNGALVATSGLPTTAAVTFPDLTTWRTAFPALDAASVDTDPLLVSAVDLHIQNGSPAISLALGSTVTTDIDGDARPNGPAPDAGADEYNPGPPLTISATDPTAAEATPSNQTGTFTLTFTAAPTVPVTVNFTMSGTAATAPGVDYILSTTTAGVNVNVVGPGGTLDVPASTSPVVLVVTPIDDVVNENPETVVFTINLGNGYDVGAPSAATVTINDNDLPPVPDFTVSSSGLPAEAGQAPGTFTLTANPTPPTPVTVNFTLTGAAALNTDYTATATGSIQVGLSGVAAITINPIDDSIIELGGETVVLTLVGGAGYTISAPSAAQLTIEDNDFPTVTVAASGSPSEAGPTNGTFTLTATPPPPGPLTVHLQYAGSAGQPGAGDYNSSAGVTVVIPVSGTVNVTITPVDDAVVETGGEDVTLIIIPAPAPPQNYIIGTPSQATMTIADNDFPPVNIPGSNPIDLPDGTFNVAYTANITAGGGNGTFTWSVAAGSTLPAGLGIVNPNQANAQIAGTPGAAGTFLFTLQVTDGLTTATHEYRIVLATGSITSGGGGGSGGGGSGGCAAGAGASALAAMLLPVLALRRRRRG